MLGDHLAVDLFDCNPAVLDDVDKIKDGIATVVKHLNADIIQILVHRFNPHGISCVALISASHIAIHTWPEKHFASADIFSCGVRINVTLIVDILKCIFCSSRIVCNQTYRGVGLYSPFFNEE